MRWAKFRFRFLFLHSFMIPMAAGDPRLFLRAYCTLARLNKAIFYTGISLIILMRHTFFRHYLTVAKPGRGKRERRAPLFISPIVFEILHARRHNPVRKRR
ncbi:uncharacterized protein K452DRAFT_123849 [Aplosporella prunicola CBS 121167]|uniref:Secreted protein n=1 Tax=Aplosporella prunicola CBS 121167 TaxID=1176127 RepID=A0A6A6BQH9_9PEZI|nr:uncharacterized protein K452DRAFT_123849 [Aplosporella prunicola CBS 121167]KAF2145683.1 hypothetical protein K452DRAFT_123849 [Aplosporella prunicola CBS 121167]